MSRDEFWRLTPYEVSQTCDALAAARRDHYAATISAAWHMAAFGRQKKMESHTSIMRKVQGGGAPKRMTDAQMKAAMLAVYPKPAKT